MSMGSPAVAAVAASGPWPAVAAIAAVAASTPNKRILTLKIECYVPVTWSTNIRPHYRFRTQSSLNAMNF